jgi:hypothetical protein
MAKFFFGDGRSSDTPEPYDVQAIVQQTPYSGYYIVAGGDWYLQVDGEWIKCDLQGALDWMMEKGYLLQGRTLPHEQFDRIMAEAIAWRDSQ